MCHLVRQTQGEPDPAGLPTLPRMDRLRPRRVAAGAAALVAGLALAALVTPSNPPSLSVQEVAAPVRPVAARTADLPAAGGVEKTALPADDGVPTSQDVTKAAWGNCHHGL